MQFTNLTSCFSHQAWLREDEKTRADTKEQMEKEVLALKTDLANTQEQLQGLQYLLSELQREKDAVCAALVEEHETERERLTERLIEVRI
jgi:hypothetical protein